VCGLDGELAVVLGWRFVQILGVALGLTRNLVDVLGGEFGSERLVFELVVVGDGVEVALEVAAVGVEVAQAADLL